MKSFVWAAIMTIVYVSNGYATTNGELYRHCKNFASRAFGNQNDTQVSDMACVFYVRGIMDLSNYLCQAALIGPEHIKNALTPVLSAPDKPDLDAVIQAYVNIASQNPAQWKYDPSEPVLSATRQISPCQK